MSWKDQFPKENRYFETENGILYNAEAIETMSKFPQAIFDAIITDPPYGTTGCKWDSVIPLEDMWRELKRIRKNRTPIVLFGSEPFASLLRISNSREYKYDWIWNKKQTGNPFLAKKQPLKIHELIIVFNSRIYYPQMRIGKMRKKGGGSRSKIFGNTKERTNNLYYPTSIIEFSNCSNKKEKLHPTQKPLALLEYLIKTYTKEKDLILDFTCGSGTTLVACENLNRRWIGIEIEPKYCEIAKKRILAEANQLKLL